MMWLFLATGFTGALTLLFYVRLVRRWFTPPLELSASFSPKGGCTEIIVKEIGKARHEVLVQAYSFTSRPIAQALLAAKARGVHVDILLDRSNEAEEHTELPFLLAEGLAPLIDSHHAIAHNKIMIIDKRTIVTGSFNFTNQAESENAENLLVIRDHSTLVKLYRQNFLEHKGHCQPAQVGKNAAPFHAAHAAKAA
jgi:phosphatidylserine/phosphatidylglycerophosphate/cardiolipin synthase-like enzyme